MSDTDLVMAPFDDDELRERIRSSTVTVDHARGADGLYRRTLGGGIYLLELLPAGTIVPELQTFDATAPVRYFTLEGKGLLRRRGELIESLVRNVGFVENANASKYFVGAWGSQLEPWEVSEDEAREIAARLGVDLETPAERDDVANSDRDEPVERSRTDDLSRFVQDDPELISFPQPNVPERYKKRDA